MNSCGRRRCRNYCARPAGRSWRQKGQTVQAQPECSAVASVPETQRLPTAIARYLSQYDREHLYKQVWSASMPKIAKHYGVTGDRDREGLSSPRHSDARLKGTGRRRSAGLPPSTPPPLPPLPASIPKHQTDESSS